MALSFYGQNVTTEDILKSVPTLKRDNGEDWGMINQMLATWCLSQGYAVSMHTADFQIIDLSWIGLDRNKLLGRMKESLDRRNVPALGPDWSKVYMQSYIDFLENGGELQIAPFMSNQLLDSLLQSGPIMGCVNFNVLHKIGRTQENGLRQFAVDDKNGRLTNHTVVIYGKNDNGQYLVADPGQQPGRFTFEAEHLLAAMTASQIECDNLVFQLNKAP